MLDVFCLTGGIADWQAWAAAGVGLQGALH